MTGSRADGAKALPLWAEVAALLVILAIAAGFRLYRIGEIPPGPHFDEASAAFDALDVLSGRHTPFSERPYGREMLFVYIAAPLVKLLGPERLAMRLPTAIVGILTVLFTYLLSRELFSGEDKRKAQLTGLVAALFLALSFWLLAINHLSFRANYVPLTETLCFLFFWRAVRTDRLRYYVLCGVFLGLGLHTYIAARFVPIVLVAFFAVLLPSKEGRSLIFERWRRWAVVALVALAVFAPLLIYFLAHPASFLERARGISIFAPYLHQGDFFGLLLRSTLGNFGTFGFRGDESWVYNLPGRPGIDAVQAALLWAGLILCLARWRYPRYLFLPVWWLVMLLPSILAPVPIPHHLRAIGTLPVAAIVSALTVSEAFAFLHKRLGSGRRLLMPALLVLVLLYGAWAGHDTWTSYYEEWLARDEVYYAYHGHVAELAGQVNQDDEPGTVYLFPVNYDRHGDDYEEFTLDLLHRGGASVHYITVDDSTVVDDISRLADGYDRVRLIVWTHGDHVDADPRQVLPFLLESMGRRLGEEMYRGYRIVTYRLEGEAVGPVGPEGMSSVLALYGNQLELVGVSADLAAPSGEPVPVALRWQAGEAPTGDLKASLRLHDSLGHRAGQSDTLLLSNEHLTTSQWQPGQAVTTYHLIPSQLGTLPGTYQLSLVVYDAQSQDSLQAYRLDGEASAATLDLGPVAIERPLQPFEVKPEVALEPADLAEGVELFGFALGRRVLNPGEILDLALYWNKVGDATQDHRVALQLIGATGAVEVAWTDGFSYPTGEWIAGDVWRTWHAVRVPADTHSGDYSFQVALAPEGLGEQSLSQISVEGRPRRFEVPDMQNPMTARIGEDFQLLGYDLAPDKSGAGETLRLTLHWQAINNSDVSYTVFTHVVDGEQGLLWGQKDSIPGGGALPTTSWFPGEVITDLYEIPIARDAPAGQYDIRIGMYEPTSGQRLPIYTVAGGEIGDALLLEGQIQIEP